MDRAGFLAEVCRRAGAPSDVPDSLAAAYAFLDQFGPSAEGQLFRKALCCIACDFGEFSEQDLWLLSRSSQRLVSALVEAKIAGRYSNHEWLRLS
jgi:hypothetical protein